MFQVVSRGSDGSTMRNPPVPANGSITLRGMATPLSLTAIYEPVENGWIQARIQELPGVITAAPSLEEVKLLLEDALREYLLAQMENGDPRAPTDGAQSTPVEVRISA
jgi:predicted RNase H-like HicB family nuclease